MRQIPENMQVIVCGPNRSGTSLIMRCLEMTGFKMAENLQPGDEGNIYGYYESDHFKQLCLRAFDRWRLEELKSDSPSNILRYSPNRDLRILLDKNGRWAWKYPWAVFVLDELFEAAANMIVIYMSRTKDDVIKSSIRHCEIQGVNPYSKKIYAQWYDLAFEAIKAYRHKKIVVNFLDLVENEKIVMNEILDFLGLETNYDCTAVDIREVHFKD